MELVDRRVFLLFPEHRDHWLRVPGENMFTANRECDVCFPGVGTPLLLLRQIYRDLLQTDHCTIRPVKRVISSTKPIRVFSPPSFEGIVTYVSTIQ